MGFEIFWRAPLLGIPDPEAIEDRKEIPDHIEKKMEQASAALSKQSPAIQKLMELLGRADKQLRGDKEYKGIVKIVRQVRFLGEQKL